MTMNSHSSKRSTAKPSEALGDPDVPETQLALLINEVQLLLAEKRTALSVLRTGIAIFVLPLSVFSVLVATSRYYRVGSVIHWLIPILAICFGLILLAGYLIVRSLKRIHGLDQLIGHLKQRSPNLRHLVQ